MISLKERLLARRRRFIIMLLCRCIVRFMATYRYMPCMAILFRVTKATAMRAQTFTTSSKSSLVPPYSLMTSGVPPLLQKVLCV